MLEYITEDQFSNVVRNLIKRIDSGIGREILYFTRDTAVASGTQDVNVPFFTKLAIFFMVQSGTKEISWGIDNGTDAFSVYLDAATGNYSFTPANSIHDAEIGGVDTYEGKISAIASDKITITWVRTGNPTGVIEIFGVALK